MSVALRLAVALAVFVELAGSIRKSLEGVSAPPPTKNKLLAVLLRTGGPESSKRVPSIKSTWGTDLEEGSLILLQADAACKEKYGDNHWEGLTCLEAKNHLSLMNRTDFDWLLVVDDDTYVFADRLRETLLEMDTSKEEVYGEPYCGECGGGRKGFCGGGGYVISRQSLLKMASSTAAPVSSESAEAFMEHFMRKPNSEWCDVRFGCVAQEKGLKAVGVRGMYGNGVIDSKGKLDKPEEGKVVELTSEKFQDAPLVLHNVKSDAHMQRLFAEYKQEKEEMKGKQTAFNVDGSDGLKKWSVLQMAAQTKA